MPSPVFAQKAQRTEEKTIDICVDASGAVWFQLYVRSSRCSICRYETDL